MPTYEYVCDVCGRMEDRSVAVMERNNQRCIACESPLRKLISVPTVHLASSVMYGMDDGFGPDQFSRNIAKRKAAAAGVNTSGAKFHPGLCPHGESFSPKAWYSSAEEAKAKARALGRNIEGVAAMEVNEPIRDEVYAKDEAPYRCAPDLVLRDAEKIINEQHDGRVTKEKAKEIVETLRDKHSGIAPNRGNCV